MEYLLNIRKNIDSAYIKETLESIDGVYVEKIDKDNSQYRLSVARYSTLTEIKKQDFFGYLTKIRDGYIDPI